MKVKEIVVEALIPSLYSIAMVVDAVIAPVIGKTYDKKGMIALIVIPVLTLPIPFLGFSNRYVMVVAALILWGAVMGIHETIMRAAIADLTPLQSRGFAYGIFYTFYGTAWFIGSSAMGFLYEISISYIFSFIVIVEVIAIILFLLFRSDFESPV